MLGGYAVVHGLHLQPLDDDGVAHHVAELRQVFKSREIAFSAEHPLCMIFRPSHFPHNLRHLLAGAFPGQLKGVYGIKPDK